ncbi:MAG: alanine--tRNA ligase [Acetobacteraceae bacterium]
MDSAQEFFRQAVKVAGSGWPEKVNLDGNTASHCGLRLLDEEEARLGAGEAVPGETAFRLYDTYGFPLDLTEDVLRGRGRRVAAEGFERAMAHQREEARRSWVGSGEAATEAVWFGLREEVGPSEFLGYQTESAEGVVLAMLCGGERVAAAAAGDEIAVIVNQTPFYAESGGQVGDTGVMFSAAGAEFAVRDTAKRAGDLHVHLGRLTHGDLHVGDAVEMRIDGARRRRVRANHSVTHLLHQALRARLGPHVTQKGSLVAPDRLRFDFSHPRPLGPADLAAIETEVNEQIRENEPVRTRLLTPDRAVAEGALALFGEKYGDEVRVLRMGDFSTELCGGTHVSRTGDIGLFKIVSESGVAAGIRRIEAVTGAGAMAHVVEEERRLGEVAGLLAAGVGEVAHKVRQLLERQRKLERELDSLKARAAGAATGDLAANAKDVGGIKLVAARVDGMDAKALREAVDGLKQKLGDCVVLLASGHDGKVSLVGGVHGAALGKIKAGDVVAHVAKQIDGKGGGRPDMAQGGGVDSPDLDRALDGLADWLKNIG